MYFAFVQGPTKFEAFKVDNWCSLDHDVKTKVLKEEEAEDVFKRYVAVAE